MFKAGLFMLILGSLAMSRAQDSRSSAMTGPFEIRTGVNVSHWLSQSEKRGEDRRRYITRADFDTIASMGFDHVRIPVDEVQLWDSLGNKEAEGFELLHDAIQWAFAANLRVIVDLHIIRAHHFNAGSNKLWTDPAEQEKLVNMWRRLSDELHQYPNDKLAYEILNEPVADNPGDWNTVLNKVIAAIRAKEPERKIVVGSNRWQIPDTFPELRFPENDSNLILSFHFYSPLALTHHTASWTPIAEYNGPVNYPGQVVDTSYYKEMSPSAADFMRTTANGYFTKEVLAEKMLPAIKIAKQYHLQLYCGEYGVYPRIPEDIMLQYYKDVCEIFNENGIAYCHWCYKGDFPVVDSHGTPNHKMVSILTAK
ncbi:MAG TPA: cellulase family glycosylhydrolase [Candidatus Acidoferrales bacterium]|nr:cellulase family glycosylhydrolase [Candidatus Acidoferrales bacterium]